MVIHDKLQISNSLLTLKLNEMISRHRDEISMYYESIRTTVLRCKTVSNITMKFPFKYGYSQIVLLVQRYNTWLLYIFVLTYFVLLCRYNFPLKLKFRATYRKAKGNNAFC